MLRASQINGGLLLFAAFAVAIAGCADNDSVDDSPAGAGESPAGAGASGHPNGGGAGKAGGANGVGGSGAPAGGSVSGGEAGAWGDAGVGGASLGAAGAFDWPGAGGAGELAGAGGEAGTRTGPSVGADGDLIVASATNLTTDNSGTRVCPDGGDAVSYSVIALGSSAATLAAPPSVGCLNVGDEVLLINLQGTATDTTNVGNYETLKVSALVGGEVTFSTPKAHFYGTLSDNDSNIGLERTNQRVTLQRVPNYASLTVNAATTLTGSAWDGVKGGVLFVRATGAVSIAGTVTMSGKGYDGGLTITTENTNGGQGESFNGLGSNLAAASKGGGGGGLGDGNGCESYGTSGGGAAYGAPGTAGTNFCSGAGGEEYGEASLLTKLMLGSGAGSGGTDNYLGDNPPGGFGGRGGGVVVILAQQLTVTGNVFAAGGDGQGDPFNFQCDDGGSVTSCWDYSGPGGGGSGGSILFKAAQTTLGVDLVAAPGGLGSYGNPSGKGGDGGVGRIALQYSSAPVGSTLPVATVD